MSTISSAANSSAYNPQIINKVAAVNSANLANNAANQSAFSTYIGQALAQIGVANPTNATAPVVSGANKSSAKEQESQKSVSTFIQDLFTILSEKNPSKDPISQTDEQPSSPPHFTQGFIEASQDENSDAIAAYNSENSTTVGNIVGNLQTLIKQLNDTSRNTENSDLASVQRLKTDFQNIIIAQGANPDNKASLGNFFQALAQNLQGQSPLGIIFNTFS